MSKYLNKIRKKSTKTILHPIKNVTQQAVKVNNGWKFSDGMIVTVNWRNKVEIVDWGNN